MTTLFDPPNDAEIRGATISECGLYRYHLWRVWNQERAILCFVMLNPSTADANEDDPTIRRCIGFAKRDGYGGISVRNLFALRATDPKELLTAADPASWCQGALARRRNGDPIGLYEPDACQWCVMGAIYRCFADGERTAAVVSFIAYINNSIGYWNDDPARTHAEVIAALKKAGL